MKPRSEALPFFAEITRCAAVCWPAFLVISLSLLASCAANPDFGGGAGMDVGGRPDASGMRDNRGDDPRPMGDPRLPTPDPEAFWADDPPPMECLEDGSTSSPPVPPGGTPDCPDDKNREGCPCTTPGEMAPCWPGLRANRSRGICRDGVTTCQPFSEFSGEWGECVGAVLPVPGVTRGPESCSCFSRGTWAIDNVSPCFITYPGGQLYGVSTFVSGGAARCPTSPSSTPPASPEPGQNWSTNRLTVDCAGRFELCFTLKAGNIDTPSPSDCTLARVCVEDWYREADVPQEFPPLPGWSSSDTACARRFADGGGYAEMSVHGLSVECDEIDDGAGGDYVFNRVAYCPLYCAERPTAPECVDCRMGGSGSF